MNNRKNQNPILVLATLGVYLGLVLAGATPQILAQAATAKQFSVKDEVEVKDDLDKKPRKYNDLDDEVAAIEQLKLAEAIRDFILDLRKLESIGKFDPAKEWNFSYEQRLEKLESEPRVFVYDHARNRWLSTAIDELIANAGTSSIVNISDKLPGCNVGACRETRVKAKSASDEFSLSFTFKKSSAEKASAAARRFTEVFVAKRVALKNSTCLPIYENTKAISDDDQVLIVTRLPRAGLDSLLASDAK